MNIAPCTCESHTAKQSVNEHPRYYARQLVTPEDMTLEHDYLRAKLRRHNRYLHGWGVVCGAELELPKGQPPPPWKIVVKSGYILGPYGDEIYIEKDQCVDVRNRCMSEPQSPQDDFECGEAQPPPVESDKTLYVAIRYVERKTRLIRVPLGGCGCEDNACEYSRLSDGYEICIIDHCTNEDGEQSRPMGLKQTLARECPECPPEPWVVLGAFTYNAEGKVDTPTTECRDEIKPPGYFLGSRADETVNRDQPAAAPAEQPAAHTPEAAPGA